jgi:hypothetical protein
MSTTVSIAVHAIHAGPREAGRAVRGPVYPAAAATAPIFSSDTSVFVQAL